MGKEQPGSDTTHVPDGRIAEVAQDSLGDLLLAVGKVFIETVMESEVRELAGARSERNAERGAYPWQK